MVGGTTANDFSNCELKVMKQQEEQKQPQPQRQKQNPLGKGKTGMRFGWRAGIQRQGYALVCAKLALDILVVVIDRMTAGLPLRSPQKSFGFSQSSRKRWLRLVHVLHARLPLSLATYIYSTAK